MPKWVYLSVMLLVSLVCSRAPSAQTLFYGMSVNIPNTTIEADVFSARIVHLVGYGPGGNSKKIFFTITPAGGTVQTLTGIDLSNIQGFAAVLSQAVTLLNVSGRLITVNGQQSGPMSIFDTAMPRYGPFFFVATPVAGVTVYEVQIYDPNVNPYFWRNYSLAGLQAFASYLNLCIAFANALP
jgi:hypothetical protein